MDLSLAWNLGTNYRKSAGGLTPCHQQPSALPKHGNRHNMLKLRYGFPDTSEMVLFEDAITEFLENYTEHPHYQNVDGDQMVITLHDLTCGYDALQLIHTFDTIINNKDINCSLVAFIYTEDKQL